MVEERIKLAYGTKRTICWGKGESKMEKQGYRRTMQPVRQCMHICMVIGRLGHVCWVELKKKETKSTQHLMLSSQQCKQSFVSLHPQLSDARWMDYIARSLLHAVLSLVYTNACISFHPSMHPGVTFIMISDRSVYVRYRAHAWATKCRQMQRQQGSISITFLALSIAFIFSLRHMVFSWSLHISWSM